MGKEGADTSWGYDKVRYIFYHSILSYIFSYTITISYDMLTNSYVLLYISFNIEIQWNKEPFKCVLRKFEELWSM